MQTASPTNPVNASLVSAKNEGDFACPLFTNATAEAAQREFDRWRGRGRRQAWTHATTDEFVQTNLVTRQAFPLPNARLAASLDVKAGDFVASKLFRCVRSRPHCAKASNCTPVPNRSWRVPKKPATTCQAYVGASHYVLIKISDLLPAPAIAVLVVGCASWKESRTRDPAVERNSGSIGENRKRVILEVEFVNIAVDTDDIDQSASLWQWIDETAIDADLRRKLFANGIRVGFVASEERFSPASGKVHDRAERGGNLSQPSLGRQRCVTRRKADSDAAGTSLRIAAPTADRGQPCRNGANGREKRSAEHSATHSTSWPITPTQASGVKQVDLHFRPEIQFGDARQKWISSDTAMRIDTRRDVWSIPELDLTVTAERTRHACDRGHIPGRGTGQAHADGNRFRITTRNRLSLIVRVAQVPSAVDKL